MAIIEVEELRKTFRSKQKDPGLAGSLKALVSPNWRVVEAVKGIGFSCEQGELLAFIGPNGAGKSTTIKMLTGILYPSSGRAHVLGLTPWEQREKLAFNIASVFGQKSQLWIHLPPLDTFNLLARIFELDPAEYKRRVDYLIDIFEIGELVRTPARKLSLGERMRCEVAAALIHRPKVLFLDEPTIGLDVIAKQKIRDLIRHLNREERVTVFLTSHDAGDIEQLCKRVIVVNHGSIILNTSVSNLRRRYLQHKIVDLKLQDPVPPEGLALPGTRVLKSSTYGVKLQVDTGLTTMEAIISALVSNYRVADITIEDPPMEQIIAAIYGGRDERAEGRGQRAGDERAEGGGQRAGDERAEGGGQRAGDERAEGGGQRAGDGDGDERAEGGGQRAGDGDGDERAGSRGQGAGNADERAADRGHGIGGREQEAGVRDEEARVRV